MARMPRKDTGPEVALRSELHRRGLRFRTHLKGLPGRPDIVFTRAGLAIFVDGCFWHRCPVHRTEPKNNSEWWAEKLEGNVQRDLRQTSKLTESGWEVLRIWEHVPVGEAADGVEQLYRDLIHRSPRGTPRTS